MCMVRQSSTTHVARSSLHLPSDAADDVKIATNTLYSVAYIHQTRSLSSYGAAFFAFIQTLRRLLCNAVRYKNVNSSAYISNALGWVHLYCLNRDVFNDFIGRTRISELIRKRVPDSGSDAIYSKSKLMSKS